MLIHTFKMMFPIHHEEVQDMQKRFDIKYTEVNKFFEGDFPGVTLAISNIGFGKWYLYMVVDAIVMLGKSNIKEDDYQSLKNEIKKILIRIFGHAAHYKEHVLIRIDYRYDIKIEDKNIQKLLMHIYKKLTNSYRFQKKYLGKMQHGVFTPYETTVYHSSNSVRSIVYLKEEERIAKGEKIEPYEKDVVRYEVQLLEDHLYYMERKCERIQRPRKLAVYLKKELYIEYFKKYMSHIYYLGDFYKIDSARKKISSSSLSPKDKIKLVDFLKQVSSCNVDTPLKKMSKSTFNKRINLLQELGINPILIPKNYPKAPSFLKNPLNDFPWSIIKKVQ